MPPGRRRRQSRWRGSSVPSLRKARIPLLQPVVVVVLRLERRGKRRRTQTDAFPTSSGEHWAGATLERADEVLARHGRAGASGAGDDDGGAGAAASRPGRKRTKTLEKEGPVAIKRGGRGGGGCSGYKSGDLRKPTKKKAGGGGRTGAGGGDDSGKNRKAGTTPSAAAGGGRSKQ